MGTEGARLRAAVRLSVGLVAVLGATGCDSLLPPDPVLAVTFDGAEVTWSSIDDGLLQGGELASVDLFVTNAADTSYSNIQIVTSAGGSLMSAVVMTNTVDRSMRIQSLGPGQTVRLVAELRVAANTAAGTPLPFTLTLTTPEGAETTLSVPLVASALPYAPTVEGVAVVADTDGDGRVEPGEEATVQFEVPFGTGTPQAGCYGFGVSTTLAQVTLLGFENDGCLSVPSRQFRFRASSLLTAGTSLPFVIRVRDVLGNTWDFPVSVPLQ